MAGRILVIGDVIDDIIVVPNGEIRPNTDTDAKIEKTLGGSAANVAAWAAHFGAKVEFVGCVNQGDLNRNLESFASIGVEATLQGSAKPTGSIVVLVQDENRAMLTDRGANQDLDFSTVDRQLEAVDVLYLSGYALLGKTQKSVFDLIQRAHDRGALVAIDPGSTGFIRDYGVTQYREMLIRADVCFPNREEAQLLKLDHEVPLEVITDGSRGATAVWSNGETMSQPGLVVKAIDPTGAGDAFCGAFLAGLTSKGSGLTDKLAVADALTLGIEAGASAVETIGARPKL